MHYLSVCSGIEAASQAWHQLGWTPVAFSEIEPFPSALLAHHYPHVPNRGDMTKFKEWPNDPVDLLVGGTPCQAFSVAGLRKGLADPRGNLALTFLGIADKYRPKWIVWENVPGVLSSNGGRDFGSFLGALVELGYGFAYRVLDAQFFGVPQRRRRVFVVACLGDWRRPAAVLFEPDCLHGNPPPSREARKAVAAGTLRGTDGGSDVDHASAGHLIASGKQWPVDVAPTLNASFGDKQGLEDQHALNGGDCSYLPEISLCLNAGGMGRQDYETETLIGGVFDVAHAPRGEGVDASEDGTGRGTPLVPVCFDTTQITNAANYSNPKPGDPCHPLAAGAHPPAIAFDSRQDCVSSEHVFGSLGSSSPQAQAVAFALRGREEGAQPEIHGEGDSVGALRAGSGGSSRDYVSVAYGVRTANTSSNGWGVQTECTHTLDRASPPTVATTSAVRRLTPTECERLQGFPDGYTQVPVRGKPAADGPRYKALGNSMAVPVMRWIGERIRIVDALGGPVE